MSLGMKVMISQPMNGKTNEQVEKEREYIVKQLESKSYEVVDTIIKEDAPNNCDPGIYYLAKSIEFIGKVDCVFFMKGWEKARGCKIEHQVAVEYDKKIMYEGE